jgi:DNA-binding XRE family transcriptional regulator
MTNEFDYSHLLARMREFRFSQNSLANAIGIGRTAMNLKFNNKSYFSQKEIRDICDVLHIPDKEVGKYFFTKVVRKTVRKEKMSI